jgi:DNA-directed RNA polymerase specialized sigma24 family protein
MDNKTKLRADGAGSTTEKSDRSANAVLDDLTHRLLEQESAFRAFLRKRLSDDAMIEALLQQSLMKAVERGHELKKSDSAVSWFYRILRNAVTDYRSHAADHRKGGGPGSGDDRSG